MLQHFNTFFRRLTQSFFSVCMTMAFFYDFKSKPVCNSRNGLGKKQRVMNARTEKKLNASSWIFPYRTADRKLVNKFERIFQTMLIFFCYIENSSWRIKRNTSLSIVRLLRTANQVLEGRRQGWGSSVAFQFSDISENDISLISTLVWNPSCFAVLSLWPSLFLSF